MRARKYKVVRTDSIDRVNGIYTGDIVTVIGSSVQGCVTMFVCEKKGVEKAVLLGSLQLSPHWREAGALFRWGSCWIGWHWSKQNQRLCINIIPCVTFWITQKGGKRP